MTTVIPPQNTAEPQDKEAPGPDETPLNFSVDAALLRQLGERLVGRPAVALAELVKNSYDADARIVRIVFEEDTIRIVDNGHGMSADAFRDFWMRIGTPHKEEEEYSPILRRPLTGSKGVGRLAVQFLAREVQVRTTSISNPDIELNARVDWDLATRAGDLTSAKAWVHSRSRSRKYAGGSEYGTAIVLRRLQQQWGPDDLRLLAQELWSLQPPFVPAPTPNNSPAVEEGKRTTTAAADGLLPSDFRIQFESADPISTETFERQLTAALQSWDARIRGVLARDRKTGVASVVVALEFAGSPADIEMYEIPDSALDRADYEVRIFKLQGKQAAGIRVEEARRYFQKYGGVQVYDSGFHLPYYGGETDWLNIELDHSHRLSKSGLLPEDLQVDRGMNFLPTNSRLWGVVRVDTSRERIEAEKRGRNDPLAISVTRDRLVEGPALNTLRDFVRWGLDFYAMQAAMRAAEKTRSSVPILTLEESDVINSIHEVVDEVAPELPAAARRKIVAAAQAAAKVATSVRPEKRLAAGDIVLLGPLATAGIATIAFDHELIKQFQQIELIVDRLRSPNPPAPAEVSELLSRWLDRARGTRALFSHIANEEDRTAVGRFVLHPLVRQVADQASLLLRDIDVTTDGLATDVRLPAGTFAEWAALFQNVFVNAANAMSKSSSRKLAISSRREGKKVMVFVQDSGSGVNLSKADELFQPFVRRGNVSSTRRALGYGGTGLGLAIVRMIARARGAEVSFTKPEPPYKTSFKLEWTER